MPQAMIGEALMRHHFDKIANDLLAAINPQRGVLHCDRKPLVPHDLHDVAPSKETNGPTTCKRRRCTWPLSTGRMVVNCQDCCQLTGVGGASVAGGVGGASASCSSGGTRTTATSASPSSRLIMRTP